MAAVSTIGARRARPTQTPEQLRSVEDRLLRTDMPECPANTCRPLSLALISLGLNRLIAGDLREGEARVVPTALQIRPADPA